MQDLVDLVVKTLIDSKLSSYRIAQETGISDQTIANYRNKVTAPKGNNLKILGNFLGIKDERISGGADQWLNNNEYISAMSKFANTVDTLARSNSTVVETNKILSESNSSLIEQLNTLIPTIKGIVDSRSDYASISHKSGAKASDVKKGYKTNK